MTRRAPLFLGFCELVHVSVLALGRGGSSMVETTEEVTGCWFNTRKPDDCTLEKALFFGKELGMAGTMACIARSGMSCQLHLEKRHMSRSDYFNLVGFDV